MAERPAGVALVPARRALPAIGRAVGPPARRAGGLIGRAVALVTAVIVLTTTATGLLYWARGPLAHRLHPLLRQSLPLDALAGHDAVPLVAYVLVFFGAGLLLALVARWVGLERLAAGLVLAALVGAWLYAVDVFSLYVVRQVPVAQAARAAARLRPVYLAAAAAGLAGAVLGRIRPPRLRSTTVLALVVGAAGLLDLVSAAVSALSGRLSILGGVAPSAIPSAAGAAVVPVGVLLVMASRGLSRGQRRAWRLALALLAISSVLHLLRGFDYLEAAATGAVALALVARGRDFTAPGDPASRRRTVGRLLSVLAVAYAYGFLAIWLNRGLADQDVTVGFALVQTSRALVGLSVAGSRHLTGSFGRWFPSSVLAVGVVGLAWTLASWFAPWRYRHGEGARRHERARDLVRRFGADSLAPFALRADKSLFMDGEGRAVLAYRVVAGVALVTGDPIGPPGAVEPLFEAFVEHAHRRGWRVVVLGSSGRLRLAYQRLGMRMLYHGDEAIIDVAPFSLDGRPIRKVRQSVHRLRRAGFTAAVLPAAAVGADLRRELYAVERAWLGDRPRTGFVMQLDDLFRLDGRDALFVVARDPTGRARGFLHLVGCPAAGGLSLSSMPREPDTPNGMMEWLVVEALSWAGDHGVRSLSLNFSPFAGLLGAEGVDLPVLQRIEREALLAVKRAVGFQFDNLLVFNRKFFPRWQPRYVVYERRGDLPRVVLAALAAEGFVPGGRRGWAA